MPGLAGSSTILRELREVSSPQSEASRVWRQLRRDWAARIGAIILVAELVLVLGAPWFAPYPPLEQDFQATLQPPSSTHLFGTDDVGRDIFSRVLYGGRISLRVGLIAVCLGAGLGTVVGLLAGYCGGVVDALAMRLMDLFLAFPGLLLALTVITVLGPGLFNVMIAVGIGAVPSYARLARAVTLALRERDFVLGARVIGCGDGRILHRYILPNVYPPLIVLVTLGTAGAILTTAGLSFVGLGAQPPTPE